MDEPLLRIRDLTIDYQTGRRTSLPVLRGVNLDLRPSETVALVGESGCGKTTLALAMLRLLPKLGRVRTGSILFRRRDGSVIDLLALDRDELRAFRWTEAAVVYQGAMNALNPMTRIRAQFVETARAHDRRRPVREIEERAAHLLELVRLEPGRVLSAHPHELSGGMRQRVLIALALLLDPQLLVLDEPTTALDILTQRSVVDVLARLRDEVDCTMVFVSHDLGLAAELAGRVATLYAGRIVEIGGVEDTFYRPRHPYTAGLLDAVPSVAGDLGDIASIPGSPPSFGRLPGGCPFHPRCHLAQDACRGEEPELMAVGDGHRAACFMADEMSDRKPVNADV